MLRRIASALFLSLGLLSVRGAEPVQEWRPVDAEESALLIDGKQVGNYRFSDKVYRPLTDGKWGEKCEPPIAPPFPDPGADALWEVNARRARQGLRPFIRDEGLTIAARGAARYRADRLLFGHTPNDFQFLPPGCSAPAAGCAAYPPDMGWYSCCCEDNATYGGAAWAMGKDGKRYMHLYVR